MSGFPNGSFQPDDSLSRAAFVKMLAVAAGIRPQPGQEDGFADTDGHWVHEQGFLPAAVRAGVVVPGDYGGEFAPDREITRQEMAIMVVRALGLARTVAEREDSPLRFGDLSGIPDWARPYVATAAETGIIAGLSDGRFAGADGATRAQAAVIMSRVLDRLGGAQATRDSIRVDTAELAAMTKAKVARVIDGDTIELEGDEKVRLIGVDTPETKHPSKPVEYYGKEASEFTKAQLEGREVYLAYDVQRRDRYGRTFAYVYLPDGTFFNAELVRQGYAHILTIPPNVKHADLFLRLQRAAREASRGLWGR